jgi:hypothetical protein
MLEIGIFCVIVLAAGYWVAMFLMGRRDDVIHGKFVQAEEEAAFASPGMPTPPPPFPKRQVKVVRPTGLEPIKRETKPMSSDALQSLLAAIQQDLRNVA